MSRPLNIFQKILLLILLLITPIISLYYYSTQKSINIIQTELINSRMNKMAVFMAQLESGIEKLETISAPLLVDTNVLEYLYNYSLTGYPMIRTRQLIQEKISLAGISSNWRSYIGLYFPSKNEVISSSSTPSFDIEAFKQEHSLKWHYRVDPMKGPMFTRYFMDADAESVDPSGADLVIEISLYLSSFENMLDSYKVDASEDPFFYRQGYPVIHNHAYHPDQTAQVVQILDQMRPASSGYVIRTISGKKYVISYDQSPALGWYLIDYFPYDLIVRPTLQHRILFGITSLLILMTGIAAAFVLYRNVQIPLSSLIKGVKRIKNEDFSYRIQKMPNNEFAFLTDNFNQMASRIHDLIENVYKEQIRSHDARLKQLQAQIHPHFLYNCLGFMINMTKMGKGGAVIQMAQNLAKYYRYTMLTDHENVTIKEELDFIRSYLEIHRLRKEALTYSIELPEALEDVTIPRLLIQPLIENALIHGLEDVEYPGIIRIVLAASQDRIHLTVEDNGTGLSAEKLEKVRAGLRIAGGDDDSCGLRNVYQRLLHAFGKEAELIQQASDLGGLKVVLCWKAEQRESERHV